jgi:crossover junction endodeoxyribonuclease RusA
MSSPARAVLDIWIPGNPVPKGRPRAVQIRGYARILTPKKTRQAEKAIATLVRTHLGPGWKPDADSDWEIHYTFHCSSRVRGDGDNLQKLVQDALQGVLFVDDRRVVAWKGEIASEASPRPGTAILAWKRERQVRPKVPISAHLGSC